MHHMFAPSSSSRWLKCTVSLAMERALNLPYINEDEIEEDENSNVFAAEGTIAHALGEYCLNENIDTSSVQMLVVDGVQQTISPEMQEYVQMYVDYIRTLITPITEYFIEQYNQLDWIDHDLGGTADFVGITGDTLDIGDLKYGQFHQVSAIKNTQLMIYALGIIGPKNERNIKRIRLHIIQPRIRPEPSVWECSIDDLKVFEKQLQNAINVHRVRLNNGSLPTNLNEYTFGEHCRFCRAMKVCRKVDAEFMEEQIMTPEQLSKMSNEQIAERLKRSKVFDKYLKTLAADAKSRLEQGQEIPGFMLEIGYRREWTDEEIVKEIATREKIEVLSVRSPTDLGKEIGNQVVEALFGSVISAKKVIKMVQI